MIISIDVNINAEIVELLVSQTINTYKINLSGQLG